jgi:ABC-type multidrug transport system fused ATPase/permease subunit
MSLLLTLWRLLDHHRRRQLVGLQLLSIVMAASTVGGIAAVLPFFAVLEDPHALERSAVLRVVRDLVPVASGDSLVIALGMMFAASVLIANAINLFGFLSINRFAAHVGDELFVRLFDAYLHCGYEFHTRSNSSVLAGRVQEGARVASGILQQALVLVTNLVMIACVAVAVVLVGPLVAVAAIFGLGVSYAALYALARNRLSRNGQVVSGYHAARVGTVRESLAAIREVLIAQASDFFARRFAQQSRSIARAAFNTLTISQSPKYVLECITVASLVGVALYLHRGTDAGTPWMAQLSFVGLAAYRLLPALQQVFAAVVQLRADRAAFAGVEVDLARAWTERRLPRVTVPDPVWHGRPRRDLRLCGVSFGYASHHSAVVRDVSLVLPAGAVIGFVGPNGSGKTTLLDLISGLLLPQSGHIEVDGVRLDDTNRMSWQSTIAYVPQQAFLFDATLAENIALGIAPAMIDRERVEAAVRLARLAECVAALPRGYEEPLGERGCRLSGGQRQRLAIARALYRDASLLILDEATSALDVTAEREIVDTLQQLRPGRTILVVAHRSGALRHCDMVFELRNGSVFASGSHEQFGPAHSRGATQARQPG